MNEGQGAAVQVEHQQPSRRRLIQRQFRWYERESERQADGSYRASTPFVQPNIKYAISMLGNAWDEVTALTISRCWLKTDIWPVGHAVILETDEKSRPWPRTT